MTHTVLNIESNGHKSKDNNTHSILFSSLFFITTLLFQLDVSAASFDCTKAKTNHEILICETPSLNSDDEKMGRIYRLARKYTLSAQVLVDDQRKFLKRYNQCASNNSIDQDIKNCAALLSERLQQLKSIYRESLSNLENTPCKETDYDYAESWGYDAIEAYEFGENIKRLIRDENVEAILVLIDGELDSLPLNRDMQGKSFSEIFTVDWKRKVLASESSCTSVGHRGFMLGSGLIWYNGYTGHIVAINGLEHAGPKTQKDIWEHNGEKLGPKCFAYNWYSGDNYEIFYKAKTNKKPDYNDSDFLLFVNSPGMLWGGSIEDYSTVITEWDSEPEVEIPVSIHNCKEDVTHLSVSKNKVVRLGLKGVSGNESGRSTYRIIKDIDVAACQILAPRMTEPCLSVKLIERREASGGSMGDHGAVSIYAIYTIKNGAAVFPLKNFQLNEKNEALSYVEMINSKQKSSIVETKDNYQSDKTKIDMPTVPSFRGVTLGSSIDELNSTPSVVDGYMPGVWRTDFRQGVLSCKNKVASIAGIFITSNNTLLERNIPGVQLCSMNNKQSQTLKGRYSLATDGITYSFLDGRLYHIKLGALAKKTGDIDKHNQCSQLTKAILDKFSQNEYALRENLVSRNKDNYSEKYLYSENYQVKAIMSDYIKKSFFSKKKEAYCVITLTDKVKNKEANKRHQDIIKQLNLEKKQRENHSQDSKYDI